MLHPPLHPTPPPQFPLLTLIPHFSPTNLPQLVTCYIANSDSQKKKKKKGINRGSTASKPPECRAASLLSRLKMWVLYNVFALCAMVRFLSYSTNGDYNKYIWREFRSIMKQYLRFGKKKEKK